MTLTDNQIGNFVSKVLHLGKDKRKEFIAQADRLIEKLETKITEDSSFKVMGFKKTGSLMKGTVLKPRGDTGVDADIAVYLDISEAKKDHIDDLHAMIRKFLAAAYPTKSNSDFQVQPRTLGIHFHESGLDVDLVPVIPILSEQGYGWQPSSQGAEAIKTSIQGQLEFIKRRKIADPRYRNIVRLLKKWRNENELENLRSFMIELILAQVLDAQGPAQSFESGIQRFFLYVAQSRLQSPISFPEHGKITEFPEAAVVILDPVNKDNNVGMRLADEERQEIVAAAETALNTIETAIWSGTEGETLDLWKEVMGRSFTVDSE
jgi:tRNA nucleotidyltransferase (CCA-adding enzyme)